MFCDFIGIPVWIAEIVNAVLYICALVWQNITRRGFGSDLEVVKQEYVLRVAWQYSVSHSGNRTLALSFSYSVLNHNTLF